MADIRMPDGTLIRGVPDGVGKDEINDKLISHYGRNRFYSMIGREEAIEEPWMAETDFDDDIKAAAAKYQLPEARLRRQIWQESKFDPNAVSEAGAQGLMQIMPNTQKELGVINPLDGSESIDKGAAYMRKMLDKFDGDYDKALAAYHSGASRVGGIIEEHGENWVSGLGPVGRSYVEKQRQDFMYSTAARAEEEEKQKAKKDAERDAELSKSMTSGGVDHEAMIAQREGEGAYGISVMGSGGGTPEERAQEQMKAQERMVDLGIRKPEDLGFSQKEWDSMTEDRVQTMALEKQARHDQAMREGMSPIEEGEREEKEARSGLRIVGDAIRTMFWSSDESMEGKGGNAMGRFQQDLIAGDANELAREARYRQMGTEYLRNVSELHKGRAGVKASKIIEEAADNAGISTDVYHAMIARQVDETASSAIAEMELSAKLDQDAFSDLPEIENFSDNPLGYLKNLAIQNTDSATLMAMGMLTRSPAVMGALFGTEVYATTYRNARMEGRSEAEAFRDSAFSATLEVSTEGIPLARLLGKSGKATRLNKIMGAVRDEALQEGFVSTVQMMYDAGVLDKDITLGEAFVEVRDAMMVGGMFGGGMAAPFALTGDIQMENANKDVKDATKALQSVVTRMQNPNERVTKQEYQAAKAEFVKAAAARKEIIGQREEKKVKKLEAKADRRRAKARKKMTPIELKRDEAREEAAKAASEGKLALNKAPTEQELVLADAIERAGNRELTEKDADTVEELLDRGLARVTPRGDVMVLHAGKQWAAEVRKAEKEKAQKLLPHPSLVDERIEVIPHKKKEHLTVDPSQRDIPIKPTPYKSPAKRKAELEARVTAKVTDKAARSKIADAIIKAEQEDAAYAQKEKADLAKQEKLERKKDKDYDAALKQARQEDTTDVAEGLIAMDEKRVSGYEGTKLGDVLRSAMNTLQKQEKKAKEALRDAFWNKPSQGELFDVTGVLVRGTRDYTNLVKIGAIKLAKIGLKYGAWTADMVGEYGDSIRPVLSQVYADSKKKVRDIMRISHEKFKSGERAGELKFAPTQYAKPGQIRNLRRQLEKLAKEGDRGRLWYERTGQEILEITGNNMDEARKFAGLLAIYSSGTAVGSNLTNALKMWADYQGNSLRMPATGTKAGRFSEQDRTAIKWLKSSASDDAFVESFGPKRWPFFTNIMREIDPDTYEAGQGATVDLWMMRAFGYDTVSPTDPQGAFAAAEIQNIADKMGWEKQQAQAAIWVAIKARWEYIQKVAKVKAAEEGLATLTRVRGKEVFEVVGEDRAEQIKNEKRIIALFRSEAMKVSLAEINAKLDQSAQDFSDYMDRHYATISWEAEPSTQLGLAFNKMPLEAKVAMQAEIAQALSNPETGRELLAEWLGLLGNNQFVGPGAWEMNVGSAVQNSVLVPKKHKMDDPEANKKAAEAMDGYAMIMGLLLMQDAVAWHKPFYAQAQYKSNGVEIIAETLGYGETKLLYEEIVRVAEKQGVPKGTSMDWAPIILDGAFRVLNFSGVDNKVFHKIIKKAADNIGINGEMELFASVGNMVSNDWSTNKKGEQYEHKISKIKNSVVKKAAARAVRELGPKIEAIRKKYAKQYGAYPTEAATVTPAESAGKKPKKGFLRFRHFSKANPKKLRVNRAGTGIRGAERASSPSTQIDVISAYPDKGFRKEVGLGPNEFVIDVRQEDMYDLSEDPLNLLGYGKEAQTFDGNMKPIGFRIDQHKVERAIMDAGYLGYYVPKSRGNMKGQARFFKDLKINRPQKPMTVDETMSFTDIPVAEIRENTYDEFEVEELDGEIYYTSEIEDAISTARQIYGEEVDVDIYDADGTLVDTDKAQVQPLRVKLKKQTSQEFKESYNEFLDELEESSYQNPLSPDERIVNDEAAVTVRVQAGALWLDFIRAFEEGGGAGGRTLDWLVDMADRHGVAIKLIAESFGEMSQAQLETFYKSRGFVREGGRLFVRVPHAPVSGTNSVKFEKIPNVDVVGMTKEIANAEVDAFAKELGLPRELIQVVQSTSELPQDLQDKLATWGATGQLNGVYRYEIGRGPVIYIVAENMYDVATMRSSRSLLIRTLVHESLGHFGLQSMLTPKEYKQFMDLIRKAFPKEVAKRGANMSQSAEGRRLAAEEVFAYMAEEILETKSFRGRNRSIIDKIIDAIRLKLAKLGWRKIDDADMIAMMQRVTEFAKGGNHSIMAKRAKLQHNMRQARIAAEWKTQEWTGPAGPEHYETLSQLDKKKSLRFEYDADGGMLVFDSNTGQALGYVLPTVSEDVLKASPGIQSWSVSGSKTNPTVNKPITETLSIGLEKARKDDPDLERFMEKIGHGKHSTWTSLADWWFRFRSSWREATEREIFDQFASIKRREKEIGIFGEESGYMSVRLAAGVDVMIRAAIEHGVPVWRDGWAAIDENEMSLLDVLSPVSQSAEMLKSFEVWLVANRARRLTREQREKLLSRDEIASALKFIRKKKLYHLFKETANNLAAYKSSVLDFAQEAGLINPETRPLWEHSDHVPFYRVLTQNDKVGPFATSRIGHVKNPIRRLTGGSAALKQPLDSIVQNLSMLMEAAVKNKAMTDVVNNFNGSGVVTKAPQAELSSALIPMQQIQDRMDEAGVSIDAVGRDMLSGIQKLTSLQAPTDENVVSILENGKKQYYYVHDTGIMRGLEGVTPSQWTSLMRVLRAPKRWLTWAITRMPDFILKNWFRDIFHAYVLGRHGTIAPGYDSVRGWAKAIREDETFRDMMAGGGVFHAGYINAVDPKGTHTAIRGKVLAKGRHGILDTPRKLWEFYTRIADGAENAHRVVVYEKALRKTGSRKQALFESRDLMDFSVRGRHGIIRFLAETVPFWSARVQGIQRTGKGFTENPRLTFMRALPITIATIALYAMNKDDERYKGLNPYDKRMYYHFFDVFRPGDHYRLPKPFEIGAIFSTIPEILTEFTLSEQPDRGAALGQSILWTAGEMLSLYPEVQIGMPIYELMMNKNTFTEAPILTMRDKNLPPSGQYSDRTNPTIKSIAHLMPESMPDMLQSPKQLEHLTRGYFGSIVDYLTAASDEMVYLANPDLPPRAARRLDETPFVKSFARDGTAKYDVYLGALYDTIDEADKVYYRVKQLKEEGKKEEARALADEEAGLLSARTKMKPAEKRIKNINAQIARVRAHKTMKPAEKREKLDKLYGKRAEAARRVYDYRPGGTKGRGQESVKSIYDTIVETLQGASKKEQVDELISQNLPRTAVLVNDMQISDEKLREFV